MSAQGLLALVVVACLAYLYWKLRVVIWLALRIMDGAATVVAHTWRWLTGHHMRHGLVTDATWLAPATRAHHASASAWHHRPRLVRTGHRIGMTLIGVGVLIAWTVPPWGYVASGLLVAALVALVARRLINGVREGRHRRDVIRPLALAAAPVLGTPPRMALASVDIPRNFDRPEEVVTITLPPGWEARPDQKLALSALVEARLPGDWSARFNQKTLPHTAIYRHKPAPPARVLFSDLAREMDAQPAGCFVVGMGAENAIQTVDLTNLTPHVAISASTGFGKSQMMTGCISQLIRRSEVDQVHVIDNKLVSFVALENVPGVYCWNEIQEGWAVAAAFRAEVQRRFRILKNDRSATFPRLILIAEEQNDFMAQTAILWQELRSPSDPKRPPYITDLATCLFQGRAVNVNCFGVYQRLSVAAAGNVGDLRDAYGYKILGRFSHHAWDSLVGTRPRPSSSNIPGRGVIVTGGTTRAVQVAYDPDWERGAFADYALNGRAPVDPFRGGVDVLKTLFTEVGDGGVVVGAPKLTIVGDDPDLIVGLRAGADYLGMSVAAFTRARERAGSELPGEVRRGRSPAWMPDDLDSWAVTTGRRAVGAELA